MLADTDRQPSADLEDRQESTSKKYGNPLTDVQELGDSKDGVQGQQPNEERAVGKRRRNAIVEAMLTDASDGWGVPAAVLSTLNNPVGNAFASDNTDGDEDLCPNNAEQVLCPKYWTVQFAAAFVQPAPMPFLLRGLTVAVNFMLIYSHSMESMAPMEVAFDIGVVVGFTLMTELVIKCRVTCATLETLGIGSASIGIRDKKKLDKALSKVVFLVVFMAFLGILSLHTGLFKVGSRSKLTGNEITPIYAKTTVLVGIFCICVGCPFFVWIHVLQCASKIARNAVTQLIHAARRLQPTDPEWHSDLVEPTLKLAEETMPQLSEGFGPAVAMKISSMWAIGLAYITVFLTNHAASSAAIATLFTFLPVWIASDITSASSLCVKLLMEINKKRVAMLKNDEPDLLVLDKLFHLHDTLKSANKGQGLGFVMFGNVFTRGGMRLISYRLAALLGTGFPIILAMRVPPGYKHLDSNSCSAMNTAQELLMETFVEVATNSSCTFSLTAGPNGVWLNNDAGYGEGGSSAGDA